MSEPPKSALRFLRFFLKEELQEEVIGDLIEKHRLYLESNSKRSAATNCWFQVFNYLRPFAIKSFVNLPSNPFIMLGSYLRTAYRNLVKVKQHGVISLLGLTVGMTCFILAALYTQYESSHDSEFKNADRIFRLAQTLEGIDFKGSNQFALAPWPLAPFARDNFSEVEAATTMQIEEVLIVNEHESFYERGIFADQDFHKVFDLDEIQGSLEKALSDPNAIVLTESLAEKLFDKKEAIGESLILDSDHNLVVQAVVPDVPKNQHWEYGFITAAGNYPYYFEEQLGQWNSNSYRAYFLLKEGVDAALMESNLELLDQQAAPMFEDLPSSPDYFLQQIKDIHLHSHINMEIKPTSDIRYIYLATSIAFIILLLALVNYMNLGMVRLDQRLKEVGMRKVMGARKWQLVSQFLIESAFFIFGGLALSLVLARVLLPYFNGTIDLDLSFANATDSTTFVFLLLILLLFGVGAGIYPAIMSASVDPIRAIKGNLFVTGGKPWGRNVLIVGQFAAAIVLAICSVVVQSQLQFLQSSKLDHVADQIVYVPYRMTNVFDRQETLRQEILKHPAIHGLTIADNLPLNSSNQNIIDAWEGNDGQEERLIYGNRIDFDFIDLFGLELVEGRGFAREFSADLEESYILNERAVKEFGWESAVGKSYSDGKVVGVVKDFHFQPLDQHIEPLAMRFLHPTRQADEGYIAMKIEHDKAAVAVDHIQRTMRKVAPEIPFDLRYWDESYSALYRSEKQIGRMFNAFTLIALFLACIGLFGIVSHSVSIRIREISVRKVLGASVHNVIGLVSGDFLKLVIIGAFLAIPIAWWLMKNWLQDFAYRINLGWELFAVAGLAAFLLASITVCALTLKAALTNPIDAIRGD